MEALLALIPSLLYVLQSIGLKMFGRDCKSKGASDNLFATIYFALSAAVIFVFAIVKGFDGASLLMGIPFGLALSIFLVFFGKALNCGGLAFTNFIMAIALVIPVFGGAIIYGETISVLQYVSIGIFFVAFYLICFGNKNDALTVNKKGAWFFRIAACIISGLVGLLIKVGGKEIVDFNQYSFLFSGFVVATIVNLIIYLVTTKNKSGEGAYKIDSKFWLWAALVAATTACGNIVITALVPIVDSAILFPIANGGQILIATLLSPFFKEKLSVRMVIGILLGCVAIVCINF